MSKNKKIFPIVSLFILFLLTIGTTFAWFFINKELEIDYVSEIVCEAGTSLEISMLNGIDEQSQEEIWTPYGSSIRCEGVIPKIEDVSGNGESLYAPTSLINDPETGELMPEGLVPASKMNSEGYGHYVEIEVKLRTTSTMNVFISGSSSIEPIEYQDTNRNVYGKFSRDYISGAARVAILEKDDQGNEDLKMLWAPNPQVQLTKTIDYRGKLVYDLKPASDVYETYSYYKYNETTKKIEKYFVTSDEYANKEFTLGSTGTDETFIDNSPLITSLTPSLDEVVEKRLVIRMWYEGTDREADQALSGGQVKMNLKFIGMQEKEATPNDRISMVDGIKVTRTITNNIAKYEVNNVDDNVYFSINGYRWHKVNSDKLTALGEAIYNQSGNKKIYFKYVEDAIYYEYRTYIMFNSSGGVVDEE